jgi:hypothetical protein
MQYYEHRLARVSRPLPAATRRARMLWGRAMTIAELMQFRARFHRHFLVISAGASFYLLHPPVHPPSTSTTYHRKWLQLYDCLAPSALPLLCGTMPSLASASTPARPLFVSSVRLLEDYANSANCSR